MKLRPSMLALAASATLLGAALSAPAAVAQPREPVIYGSQLMTQQERLEYRERLRSAHTAREREQIRQQHHREMQVRARERGVTLPDSPRRGGVGTGVGPAPGAGPGPGPGAGPGAGGGRR